MGESTPLFMQIDWRIVSTEAEFASIIREWAGPVVADVETRGKLRSEHWLLGLALSPTDKAQSIYIPFYELVDGIMQPLPALAWKDKLGAWLKLQSLIGYNHTYDQYWIDSFFSIASNWIADPMVMWHLSDNPLATKRYGLKAAQKELLGWEHTNEEELDTVVRARGGSLDNGDHYLAPTAILAKYACLDTYSTSLVYNKLRPWFDQHEYWWFLRDIMAYMRLLAQSTHWGIVANKEGLIEASKRLIARSERSSKALAKAFQDEIRELERDWRQLYTAKMVRKSAIELYNSSPERWKRFNWNSDKDKRDLFFGKLGYTPVDFTEGGKPQTNIDTIKTFPHKGVPFYLKFNDAQTLLNNFVEPYLEVVENGRIYPSYNITGTVSGRLSDFEGGMLRAPFSESFIFKHFTCDEGYEGIHADLSAIEPTITAHFSEDPTLLKVFRDGLGDIYLDLAKDLLVNDEAIQTHYNPHLPVTQETKKRFSKQRNLTKVIYLSVQYTGTGHTVAKNLCKVGIPTTVAEADNYVKAYWRKFRKVAEFNYRLHEEYKRVGHVRNVVGRIIQVPYEGHKDLMNRFVQSSAHDVLRLWVMQIKYIALCRKYGIITDIQQLNMKQTIPDIHDSTTWQFVSGKGNYERARQIFVAALGDINSRLGLAVTIRADIKRFRTLAGLKVDED